MITKNFALSSWLLLCCFGAGMCSDCTYIEGNYHHQSSVYSGYHGICTGVTSDFSLDPNPPNASTVNILYVEGNSSIAHLQATPSLSSLVSVKYLTMKKVGMKTISPGVFRGLNQLSDLSLNLNEITEIPPGVFSDVTKLEKLFISKNQISKISVGAFAGLSSLKYLDLSNNRISQIEDGALSDLTALQTLDIDNNKINVLQANLFQNLKSLERLFVSNNLLSDWQNVAFGPKVGVIMASNNSLNSFNINISDLVLSHFDISGSKLEEFDFSLLGRVSNIIKLGSNHIRTLKNFESANVQRVDLSRNELTEIKNIPIGLFGLTVSHNKISRIERVEASKRYKLQVLDLSYNELDSFKCSGFRQLKTLILSHNDLSLFDASSFSGCRRLRELNLASNKIENLEWDVFKNLTSLKTLDVSGNSLKSFDGSCLVDLNGLVNLSLQDNKISSLDARTLTYNVRNLKEVKLSGNPLACGDWQSMLSVLERREVKVLDKDLLESSCI